MSVYAPSAPAAAQPSAAEAVTVGLVSGETRLGLLERFSPDLGELALELGGRVREYMPVATIAYIGFQRAPDEPPGLPEPGAELYKIHVTGGAMFPVYARPDPKTSGFRAVPRQAESPFREFYFFGHGVRRREKDEPIGTMLVQTGAVHPDALEHAIVAQRTERSVPIGRILVEQLAATEGDVARAMSQQKQRDRRIGELLVEQGVVTPQAIEAAVAEQQRRKGKRLGEVLLELGVVTEQTLTRTLAKKFDLKFVDLDELPLNLMAAREIPKEIIQRYGILPIDKTAKGLVVATSDPLALEGLDHVRFATNRRVEEVLVTQSALKRKIDELCGTAQEAPDAPEGRELEVILKRLADAPQEFGGEASEDVTGVDDPSDSAIVSLVNQIIAEAYRRGASDIHIEPNGREEATLVRFRIDGECVACKEIPGQHRNAVVARIKIMARLDIAERRKPQDGKIRFRLSDRQIELRVATIPTVNGNEDVVMRLLAASKPLPLSELALSTRNQTELERIIQQPYGLILCVGPTGSGKTTTLHSALGAINTVDTKIWTAEDPVEITQPGLRQVQVNARIGFTFAQAMRAFLRADPDVIMVGEMRDQETASTAIEASLTGHLVFSTLHTNSAPETVTRLLDMGLDPFSFADALLGVLAQRLARRLCKQCRERTAGTREDLETLGAVYGTRFQMWRAKGCEVCNGTGYKGRVGLHELLVADDRIKQAILRKASVDELRQLAREQGMKTLAQDGAAKAIAGITDLKQVLSVCVR